MSRPKGSKNKKKPEVKEEEVIEVDDEDCCEDSEQKLEEPIAA